MAEWWRTHPLLREDRYAAQEALDREGVVDARHWAILVGVWTEHPTCYCVYGEGGKVKFVATETVDHATGEKRVCYLRPYELASEGTVWHTRSGGQMRDWVQLLADDGERRSAWNGAQGAGHVEESPDEPGIAERIREHLPPERPQPLRVVEGGLDKLTRAQLEAELTARIPMPEPGCGDFGF